MALFGWDNAVEAVATVLAASSQVAGYEASMLRVPLGSSATAWQTAQGVTAASLTITAAAAVSWRALCLARTNLTPAATLRVRLGDAGAFNEEATSFATKPVAEGWIAPTGSYTRTHNPGTGKATAFDASGVLQEYSSSVPRIGYDPVTLAREGYLLEPSRTNRVMNPRCEGAAAGAPGTLPTNFTATIGPSGISQEVIGTGSEDGIPYLDIRFSGTAGSSGDIELFFHRLTGLSASQVYNHSAYFRLIAGTLPALTIRAKYLTSGPAFISNANGAAIVPTTAPLRTQLREFTDTTVASTANMDTGIALTLTSGVAYDFTLRIGAPQCELGSFATSRIFPAVGSPANQARGAESATWAMPVNAGTVSMFLEWKVTATRPTNNESMTVRMRLAGDSNNSIRARTVGGAAYVDVVQRIASVDIANGLNSLIALGAIRRDVLRHSPAALTHHANGALIDTLAGVSLAPAEILVTSSETPAYLRELRLYPDLTAAQGLALSSLAVTPASTLVAPIYDSGTVSSGVTVGIGQALHAMASAVSAAAMLVDIADPTNPDGRLNIPLAYAGPCMEAAVSIRPDRGIDLRRADAMSRGGGVFVQLLSRARNCQIEIGLIRDTQAAWLDQIEAVACGGKNILFVPRPSYSRAAAEAVFGLMTPGRRSFLDPRGAFAKWAATITERL